MNIRTITVTLTNTSIVMIMDTVTAMNNVMKAHIPNVTTAHMNILIRIPTIIMTNPDTGMIDEC